MRKNIRGMAGIVAIAATGYGIWRLWRLDWRLCLALLVIALCMAVASACREPEAKTPPGPLPDPELAVETARRIRQDARREYWKQKEGLN